MVVLVVPLTVFWVCVIVRVRLGKEGLAVEVIVSGGEIVALSEWLG